MMRTAAQKTEALAAGTGRLNAVSKNALQLWVKGIGLDHADASRYLRGQSFGDVHANFGDISAFVDRAENHLSRRPGTRKKQLAHQQSCLFPAKVIGAPFFLFSA